VREELAEAAEELAEALGEELAEAAEELAEAVVIAAAEEGVAAAVGNSGSTKVRTNLFISCYPNFY
jgi:hypothetical protein